MGLMSVGVWQGWRLLSIEPLVLLPVMLVGWLYWRGATRIGWARDRAARRRHRWRLGAFYGGLASILVALDSPVDYLAQLLFWVHMVQHLLLLVVAAPLIVAGAPWMPVWRGLPLSFRRWLAPQVLMWSQRRLVKAGVRVLWSPVTALVLLTGVVWGWHIPSAYDLSLRNQAIHDLEHLSFLVAGVLYWVHTMDSVPLRRSMHPLAVLGYLLAGAFQGWMLAMLLGFAAHPFYAPYVELTHRPGGISALTDQQIGAGMMWVPASIPFTILVDITVFRWLRDDEREADEKVRNIRGAEEVLSHR